MSSNAPYAQYRNTAIETASQTRLVVMLYEGAIKFLSQAVAEMKVKNYEGQSRGINKAQAILAHLRDTLDFERGGSVACSLDQFYTLSLDTLTSANFYDRIDKVERVIEGLREIREAWVEVDRLHGQNASPSGYARLAA